MIKTELIWMNGKFVGWDEAKIHILTHGLHYGTSVFEGIRCYETINGPAVFRLKDHIKRLFDGAKVMMMNIPFTMEEIFEAVKETVRVNRLKECYIRPIVYYGYKEMGINPMENPIDVAIACWPWGTYLGEEGLKRGVRCKVSSWLRIDSRMLPPLVKVAGNYVNSVLAKLEALKCGYDEAILVNFNGRVAEGPGENIFIVKNGTLITPPLSAGALSGITRDSVITIAKDQGISIIETDILREQLFLADEAFFTGTAAEVTPIREIDGRVIGNGSRGPITEKLQSEFFRVVRGEDEKYLNWLDFV
ncbi:MAG: branched-chain amino acid transaminase [archaeon]|nr:branched-chain amino acid transaminase [archaeon]MCP8319533.1 branched-chain amino acid transaminase [archaeon]